MDGRGGRGGLGNVEERGEMLQTVTNKVRCVCFRVGWGWGDG